MGNTSYLELLFLHVLEARVCSINNDFNFGGLHYGIKDGEFAHESFKEEVFDLKHMLQSRHVVWI
jgi:hypothetical protein